MSWSSKSLPWIIPNIFLTVPNQGTVIIVSPWIENVVLQVFRWEGNQILQGETLLTNVMRWMNVERNINFRLYVRDDQLFPAMNKRLEPIFQEVNKFTHVIGVANLHAKIIVTDSLVLETSANILTRSLYTNIETISIYPNPNTSAKLFIDNFFMKHNLLIDR